MAPTEGQLHIRRHLAPYRVACDRSAALVGEVERAIRDGFPKELPTLLPATGDESVWLIRRLDVAVRIGTSWTASRIATVLARATVAAVAKVVERHPDGESVLWFPDRAALLSRFLVDAAEGRAGGRWEYFEFDDLTHRSPSAAVRAVVEREPAPSLTALTRLGPADLRRVLAQLTPRDGEAVLDAFGGCLLPSGDPTAATIAALARTLDASALPADPRLAALSLFIDSVRHEQWPPTVTASRAREAAAVAAVLHDAPAGVAEALAAGRWRELGAHELARLAGFVTWPPEARRAVVDVVTTRRSVPPAASRPGLSDPLTTQLGGMFLLLPLLRDVPWAEATAHWPAVDGVSGSAVANYLAVIGALGPSRRSAAVVDPVLRLALGVPPAVDAAGIDRWARAISATDVRVAAREFVARLAACLKVSGRVTLAAIHDGVVAVDEERGLWLGAAPASPGAVRDLCQGIRAALPVPTISAGAPWIDACLAPGEAAEDRVDARLIERLDADARDASLGPPFDLPGPVRDLVMVAAQVLMRELAWRLPGFSRSSLAFLSENVLAFGATVFAEPQRVVVHVGDPPLHLLLSLTGMNRRSFRLDTTGEREWVVTRAP